MTLFYKFRYSGPFMLMMTFSLACVTVVAPAKPTTPTPNVAAAIFITATSTMAPIFITATPLPPTATFTPTATPTPTNTPTATPTLTREEIRQIELVPGVPSITTNTDLNVRTGPGLGFARLGILPPGTTIEIIGRVEDGSWWQIIYPQSEANFGWVADGFGAGQFLNEVPIVQPGAIDATIVRTSTPIVSAVDTQPPATLSPPPQPENDFVIIRQRLRSNSENGGVSLNGSATTCGFGHEINVLVVDVAGRPLNGVIIGDTYNNPRQITGSQGPGRAQYVLFGNGYNLLVIEDQNAGRAVTSETSPVMSAKDIEIPIPWLIQADYCADEAECAERISKNGLCQGHYSYDITFQRQF